MSSFKPVQRKIISLSYVAGNKQSLRVTSGNWRLRRRLKARWGVGRIHIHGNKKEKKNHTCEKCVCVYPPPLASSFSSGCESKNEAIIHYCHFKRTWDLIDAFQRRWKNVEESANWRGRHILELFRTHPPQKNGTLNLALYPKVWLPTYVPTRFLLASYLHREYLSSCTSGLASIINNTLRSHVCLFFVDRVLPKLDNTQSTDKFKMATGVLAWECEFLLPPLLDRRHGMDAWHVKCDTRHTWFSPSLR